ncbi:MAG: hypothetical protein KDA22_16720 [Phycisphaerales bacterium]|nr:hypothetical protein [Phycisphaerales bacterium]
MQPTQPVPSLDQPQVYDEDGDRLLQADSRADRIVLLPAGDPRRARGGRDRIRIQWGQHLLADVAAGRYRTLVCGVNARDNSHGIIAQLAALIPASQWNTNSITHYAEGFARSIGPDEVLVLKYDLDLVEVLALLRPINRDHFTVDDLARGFRKAAEMLEGRRDRLPSASVSFLGAKSNRLLGPDGGEPTLETVLRTAYDAGFRGDLYPPLTMWRVAPTGVFASYPFPEGLEDMRQGSS